MKDLKNRKFGFLKALRDSGERSKAGRVIWVCKCDCGETKNVISDRLISGRVKSCGHLQTKGYGDIPGKLWGDFKYSAKRRKLKFSIKIEDAWKLFLKQGRKCAITGISLVICRGRKGNASLDRIDSGMHYMKIENVQWVHKDINAMKGYLDQDHFIDMCKKVSDYQEKNETCKR